MFKTVTPDEDFDQMIFTVCGTQHKINEKWIRLSGRFKMGQKTQPFLTTVVMKGLINLLVSDVDVFHPSLATRQIGRKCTKKIQTPVN